MCVSEARDIEVDRQLRELLEELTRVSERLRVLILAYSSDRKTSVTRQDIQNLTTFIKQSQFTAPPNPAPSPSEHHGIWAVASRMIIGGGWPAFATLSLPFAFGAVALLVWYSIATNTPLTTILLILLGIANGSTSGP